VTDLLRDLIEEWKYFKPLSVGQLLEFNHYVMNKLRVDETIQLRDYGRIDLYMSHTHNLCYVPWEVRFPDDLFIDGYDECSVDGDEDID
jgi:hypothetical protein